MARRTCPRARGCSTGRAAELKASGIDVGGHTVNRVALVNVPVAQARAEVQGCRDDIARHLGAVPHHFAYPNCYYSTVVRGLVADTGFETAVTGPQRPTGAAFDAFTLRRKMLCENSTLGLGYSSALARCHFDDVFSTLKLRRREVYERAATPVSAR